MMHVTAGDGWSLTRGVLISISLPPDGEDLQPGLSRRQLDVAERIRNRRHTTFYLTRYTFDVVAMAVSDRPILETDLDRCEHEVMCVVDHDRLRLDGVFRYEPVEKQFRQRQSLGLR